jgi:bifunctional ADP-heptose synthase (sugar kinase/adenylyltransferase)
MAVMLAAGATMSEAARLANEAAGLSVAKFGPATVSLGELLRIVDASALHLHLQPNGPQDR